jgi:hypothetical protein
MISLDDASYTFHVVDMGNTNYFWNDDILGSRTFRDMGCIRVGTVRTAAGSSRCNTNTYIDTAVPSCVVTAA